MAVPELQALRVSLAGAHGALLQDAARLLTVKKKELTVLRENVFFKRPAEMLQPKKMRLDSVAERFRLQTEAVLQRRRHVLKVAEARLTQLNPMKVLERGYAVVRKDDGTVVSSPEMLTRDENFTVTLRDGSFSGKKI